MSLTITLPQARIALGWATVQGKRIPVEIDMEWMLAFARLVERTGGTSGDTNFSEYINQLFDAPPIDAGTREALRLVDELRNELASLRSAGDPLRAAVEDIGLALEGLRNVADLRARLDEIELTVDSMRPNPLPPSVEQFIAPVLLNAWANFGGVYNPAGYYKDPFGVVHLRGLVKAGVVGTALFTLPAGYCPANKEVLATISNGAVGYYELSNTGNLVLMAGSNAYASLDGLTFRAA